MKRNKTIFIWLCIVFGMICGVALLASCLIMVLMGPDIGSGKYYDNPDNYDTIDCKITYFVVSSEYETYYLDLELITVPPHRAYVDSSFRIDGDNYAVAQKNGIEDNLKEETEVQIKVASKYLGDGWIYPIAGLTCNGVDYLPFEVGYKNIAKYQYEAGRKATVAISISGSALLLGLLLLGANFIIFFKVAKPDGV
ncbi:MAG: hypothetical protein J1F33_05235 [Clostridiales bacterium]|nr:hypothetical protein [Clostridiales bacterium]